MVEQRTFNARVGGSSPLASTNYYLREGNIMSYFDDFIGEYQIEEQEDEYSIEYLNEYHNDYDYD